MVSQRKGFSAVASILCAVVLCCALGACGNGDVDGGAAQNAGTVAEDVVEKTSSDAEAAVAEAEPAAGEFIEFTDDAGRTVQLPAVITRVAPTGPVSQQVMLTFDPALLCGLSNEIDPPVRDALNFDGAGLDIFGQVYGGKSAVNKEAVAATNAQVVIDIGEAKASVVEDLDELQAQLGIPCIHIESSIKDFSSAYRTLGQILGNPERGNELADYCDEVVAQMNELMAKVDKADYVRAAYLIDETHAIAKTSVQAQLLDWCADNVVVCDDVASKGTGNEISLEQMAVWDPDFIVFQDENLYDSVADDPVWSTISAVKNGNYVLASKAPWSWMGNPPSVNILLGMQWLPRILYPDQVGIDDLQEAMTTYFKVMYNRDLSDAEYQDMMKKSLLD